MNSKPVYALPEVAEDLKEAAAHYQSWRRDGQKHLLGKYEETIDWLSWNPDLFPRKYRSIQYAILKQSYYVIYFLQETNRSLVLAVLDGRRSPRTIRSLLSNRKNRS